MTSLTTVTDGMTATAAQHMELVNGLHGVEGPEGWLQNGKIVVTVASNNLTLAIKNLAGNDPTAADPVACRIGGAMRLITTALSVTVNAGNNSFNAGGAELATKVVDYFAYLAWASGPAAAYIGFSRISYAALYSDFSATVTNEKYGAFSSAPAGTDSVVVIARFAATLSAGAGYTWTVPAFTSSNLIQRPIYESSWLSWTPAITYSGGTTDPTSNTPSFSQYKVGMNMVAIRLNSALVRGTGNRTATTFTLPFTPTNSSPAVCVDTITATGNKYAVAALTATNTLVITETMANDGNYFITGQMAW